MTRAEQDYLDKRKAYLQAMADLELPTPPELALAKAWEARRLETEQLKAHIAVYAERLTGAGISTDLPTIERKDANAPAGAPVGSKEDM
jgi:hypothetical protein